MPRSSPFHSFAFISKRSAALILAFTATSGVILFCRGQVIKKRRDEVHTEDPQQPRSSERMILKEKIMENQGQLTIASIGIVRSIYRLCVGTPRQGLLAPHSRGRIELNVSIDAVDGLEEYSHLWIVFVFHLNTVTTSSTKQLTKVAPPALGGKKVGMLATRSPHRFNPIGITLVQLDRISGKTLFVSGIDLVDGTPVVDIKPFVPRYDGPTPPTVARIPVWVERGLCTHRSVTLSNTATSQLEALVRDESSFELKFYNDGNHEEKIRNVTECIKEVLSMDVRSVFQTTKARRGYSEVRRSSQLAKSFNKDRSSIVEPPPINDIDNMGVADRLICTQQLDNLLLFYNVTPPYAAARDSSFGSGAEDLVTVLSIERFH